MWSEEERNGRNGTSKNCRRRYLDTAEEDYQEEARKRKVGKKEKKAKKANKRRRKMRKSKKEFEALRGWPSKDKTPFKGGIARRLRMKKKKKVGKKATKWQDNGKRSNILDDLIERRRMEGSSLKLDVMQKVPELVVNERMSQGKKEKDTKEKKKVPGWSIEEVKERPNIAVEEDTEEMKRWRSLNQSEMDLRRKKLAERMEEEVLDKYRVEESERGAFKGRGKPLGMEKKYAETRDIKIRK